MNIVTFFRYHNSYSWMYWLYIVCPKNVFTTFYIKIGFKNILRFWAMNVFWICNDVFSFFFVFVYTHMSRSMLRFLTSRLVSGNKLDLLCSRKLKIENSHSFSKVPIKYRKNKEKTGICTEYSNYTTYLYSNSKTNNCK